MVFSKVEEIIGEPIPKCIKKILSLCGYDTMLYLGNISAESLSQIESNINIYHRDIMQNFECSHADLYKNQDVFHLLPGHSDLLIAISNCIKKNGFESKCHTKYELLIEEIKENSALSVIMKELTKTALRNENVEKHNAQYSDIMRYFATYIFLLCGRSCYEVLYKNLPLPSISTVCK